ncbi:MAG: hypothetical protein RIS52_676 [Pseudomonadota bacterium]
MTSLSVSFSRAVAKGRNTVPAPDTREGLLVTLLRKRAAAQNAGAEDLESLLRSQILWALPTFESVEGDIHSAPCADTPRLIVNA